MCNVAMIIRYNGILFNIMLLSTQIGGKGINVSKAISYKNTSRRRLFVHIAILVEMGYIVKEVCIVEG